MSRGMMTDPGPEAEPRIGRGPAGDDPRSAVRTAAAIQGALLAGVVMATVVMAMMFGRQGGAGAPMPATASNWLPLVGYALAATMIPAGVLMRTLMLKQATDPATGRPYAGAIVPASLVCAAMIESVGIFGAVLILLMHQLMPGVALAGVSAAALLVTMPGAPWLRPGAASEPPQSREPEKWRN